MIKFEDFTLSNGLKIIVHEDFSTPLAVVNVLYNVGSKDEDDQKTGFAHLFEHLMFGGSVNISSYDEHLQKVGGENNAFTSPDITNYYIQLPAVNIETAFWLESDRMLGLSFDPKSLEVQRKVVVEEFKQRYLNQPYGDAWLHLRPLAYKTHPYRWATIGKEISHIEEASMEDVKSFFKKFYHPTNAILAIAGNVSLSEVKVLAEKWFGSIPAGTPYHRELPMEPVQDKARQIDVSAKVPLDALYKVYHMPGRIHNGFHAGEFISDILGKGKSSRLYQKLVREKQVFNSLNTYVTGSDDPGLMVISGMVNEGYSLKQADKEVTAIISDFERNGPGKGELDKMKNQAESDFAFAEVEILNKAMNLAYFLNLGDAGLYNEELEKIRKVSQDDIRKVSAGIFAENNCSTLYYHAENKASNS
ncbi:MAG TPA: pitrilysin family protein [Cyclobacteriaceae bacterium]|nr:pitrilysin family protein [Cyclobacteriaceae bacterium]